MMNRFVNKTLTDPKHLSSRVFVLKYFNTNKKKNNNHTLKNDTLKQSKLINVIGSTNSTIYKISKYHE